MLTFNFRVWQEWELIRSSLKYRRLSVSPIQHGSPLTSICMSLCIAVVLHDYLTGWLYKSAGVQVAGEYSLSFEWTLWVIGTLTDLHQSSFRLWRVLGSVRQSSQSVCVVLGKHSLEQRCAVNISQVPSRQSQSERKSERDRSDCHNEQQRHFSKTTPGIKQQSNI